MKKALYRLFVGFSLVALMITLVPFHITHAEQIETEFGLDNIIGFELNWESGRYVNTNNVETDYYDNNFTFLLDDHYIGLINQITLTYDYYGTTSRTFYNVGINGTSFNLSIPNTGARITKSTVSISRLVVNGKIYRQVDFLQEFPWESFPIQAFNLANNPLSGIDKMYAYKFNVFKIVGYLSNDYSGEYTPVHQFYGYKDLHYYWIFWIDKNVYSDTFSNYFSIGQNIVRSEVKVLNRFHYEGHTTSLVKVTLVPQQNGGYTLRYINQDDALYMPVYFNLASYEAVSTDFALQFDLNNRLLNDLDNLGGTQSSDQSADNLEDNTSQMIDDQEDLFAYEDDFNENMNDALDDINVNFNIGNTFGSKFLASAQWVRQQFDALTSTSPFGSVLSFSLLLGLALLIIGKAVK